MQYRSRCYGAPVIIPQEPVLLSASLRCNVDPFGQHSDEELHAALVRVRLGHKPLDLEVAEGGASLSVSERQLLCIARAFLRRLSLIIVEEATASVDNSTDAFLQTGRRLWHTRVQCWCWTQGSLQSAARQTSCWPGRGGYSEAWWIRWVWKRRRALTRGCSLQMLGVQRIVAP